MILTFKNLHKLVEKKRPHVIFMAPKLWQEYKRLFLSVVTATTPIDTAYLTEEKVLPFGHISVVKEERLSGEFLYLAKAEEVAEEVEEEAERECNKFSEWFIQQFGDGDYGSYCDVGFEGVIEIIAKAKEFESKYENEIERLKEVINETE